MLLWACVLSAARGQSSLGKPPSIAGDRQAALISRQGPFEQ